LQQIVALKFIGLNLRQIKDVLERSVPLFPQSLRLQRTALEEKHRLLTRAIAAIKRIEEEAQCGVAIDSTILKRLIEVVMIDNYSAFMKQFFGDEILAQFGEIGDKLNALPKEEWKALGREIHTASGLDPNSEEVQALLARSEELAMQDPKLCEALKQISADPAFLAAAKRASAEEWPAGKLSEIRQGAREMAKFLRNAHMARIKPR